jgi:tetratricopeptide (TPR) repeat protein
MPSTLLHQGYAARFDHRLPDARDLFTRAVAKARKSKSSEHLVQALVALAKTERDLNEPGTAHLYYQEAAHLYRQLNDSLKLAHTLRHLADILQDQGHYTLAEPKYVEALTIYRAHPETPPLDLANALRDFAILKTETFKPRKALTLWREARALYDSLDLADAVAEADGYIAKLTQP